MESPPSEPFPIKTIPTYSRKSPSILTKLRVTSNNPQNTVWKALLNKTVKQRELISLDIRCILRLIKEIEERFPCKIQPEVRAWSVIRAEECYVVVGDVALLTKIMMLPISTKQHRKILILSHSFLFCVNKFVKSNTFQVKRSLARNMLKWNKDEIVYTLSIMSLVFLLLLSLFCSEIVSQALCFNCRPFILH